MAIWRRNRKPSPETEQARRMLEEAERDLAAARAEGAVVDAASRRIMELRRRNRFGAMITEALRGTG